MSQPETYTASKLVYWLHSFPHISLSFTSINHTFAPTQALYREALYLVSAWPVVWLLLTLLVLLVYMCLRCCWCVHKPRSRKSPDTLCCVVWAVIILIIINGILLSLSFYGNERANDGLSTIVNTIVKLNRSIDIVRQRVNSLTTIFIFLNTSGLNDIKSVIYRSNLPTITTDKLGVVFGDWIDYCSSAITKLTDVYQSLEDRNLNKYIWLSKTIEFYRWLATLIILVVVVIVCLSFLIGVIKRSRCFIIWAVFLSFFSLILLFIMTGLYLAVNVATADFCVDPNGFIISKAPGEYQELVKTYIICNEDPFFERFKDASSNIDKVNGSLSKIKDTVRPFGIIQQLNPPMARVRQNFKYADSNITRLGGLISCTTVHGGYVDSLYGLCDVALLGMVFLMFAAFLVGFAISIMVCLTSPFYIKACCQRKERCAPEERGPFLPRPPPYNGYGSAQSGSIPSVHEPDLDTGPGHIYVRSYAHSEADSSFAQNDIAFAPGGSPPPAPIVCSVRSEAHPAPLGMGDYGGKRANWMKIWHKFNDTYDPHKIVVSRRGDNKIH